MTDRFLLWIDAVGGFLVCGKDRVRLGRAASGRDVEIPLQADIAGHHATLQRQGDCYLVEPADDLWVGDERVRQPHLLRHGDLLRLGSGVTLRFVQPHALSATARLERVSHHRTRPAADGIILLAESCVLGPANAAHIPCRRWAEDVILYRCDGAFCVRCSRPYHVDGRPRKGRAQLTPSSRVVGEDFSFCLEELP